MSLAERVIDCLARSLPSAVRERYREEWQSDLDGAEALGLRPGSVVLGAASLALHIDRHDPALHGMTAADLGQRRARWAAAWLTSAAVLGVGLLLWAGFAQLAPLGRAVAVAALIALAVGVWCTIASVLVTFRGRPRAANLGVAIVVAAVILLPFVLLGGGLLALLALPVAVAAAAITFTPSSMPGERRVTGTLIAVASMLVTLAATAWGILQITVWNPQAKLPGMTIDEIYAGLAAAGETPSLVILLTWTVFWSLAAIALPVTVALAPRGAFGTRRALVAGLLIAGGALTTQWLAGFSMGMSIADAFATSGGDASITGALMTILGQVLLVAALFVAFVPPSTRSSTPPTGLGA